MTEGALALTKADERLPVVADEIEAMRHLHIKR